jgi:putative redox protein
LLLMSLAGCSSTAIVVLLRKMGKTVSGFTVNAQGIKRLQPLIMFKKITLEFQISSPDATVTDLEKAIELAERSACPVWQMVKSNVEVVPKFTISPI